MVLDPRAPIALPPVLTSEAASSIAKPLAKPGAKKKRLKRD
jgi:hypothetical protein